MLYIPEIVHYSFMHILLIPNPTAWQRECLATSSLRRARSLCAVDGTASLRGTEIKLEPPTIDVSLSRCSREEQRTKWSAAREPY